jgi:ATP-dependent Lhr-like helicase
LSGEVAWGRLAPRASAQAAPTRAAPISIVLRKDLPWLLSAVDPDARAATGDDGLSEAARKVLSLLSAMGASFFEDLVRGAGLARVEVEDALWELVSAGRITGDGFAGLRGLLGGEGRSRSSTKRFVRSAPVLAAGRWALLRPPSAAEGNADADPLEPYARQLLRRWGVVMRELCLRESRAPAWRDLVRVFRRLEMRGEIRGGRLVSGFVGEQFALPEALEALRAMRNEKPTGEVVRISACDPLNLVGFVAPGSRVASTMGNEVLVRDGWIVEQAAETGPVLISQPEARP